MIKPKIQSVKKLGHLIQVGFGVSIGFQFYGRAATRSDAAKIARVAFKHHLQKQIRKSKQDVRELTSCHDRL